MLISKELFSKIQERADEGYSFDAINLAFKGVDEGLYTEEQLRADLDAALLVAYCYAQVDTYVAYLHQTEWLKGVESLGKGMGVWNYRYAVALTYTGRMEEAFRYAKAATEVEPAYPWGWLHLSKLYYGKGDTHNAVEAANRGLALEPGDYEFLTLLDDIAQKRGFYHMLSHYIAPEDDKEDAEANDRAVRTKREMEENAGKQISMDRFSETGAPGYTPGQRAAVTAHLEAQLGKPEVVYREIASYSLNVDVGVFPPTAERDFYTLATIGMGAFRMTVPEEWQGDGLERAELMLALPPGWNVRGTDGEWYWPIQALREAAKFPEREKDLAMAWGVSVRGCWPMEEHTDFAGYLLVNPCVWEKEGNRCDAAGEAVNFYQIIPLYETELDYKREHGPEGFLKEHGDRLSHIADPQRGDVTKPQKIFALRGEEIKPLLEWDGPQGCLATDRILVDGCKVGYMYREAPNPAAEWPDSGWRFFAGDESGEYMDDPQNSGAYPLNMLANYDPDIIQFLNAETGTAYYRDEEGFFRERVEPVSGRPAERGGDAFLN